MISCESSPTSVHPGGIPVLADVVEVVGAVRVVEVVGEDVVDDVGDEVVDVGDPDGRLVDVDLPVVLHPLSTIAAVEAKTAELNVRERPDPRSLVTRSLVARLMEAPSGDRSCHQRGPRESQPSGEGESRGESMCEASATRQSGTRLRWYQCGREPRRTIRGESRGR